MRQQRKEKSVPGRQAGRLGVQAAKKRKKPQRKEKSLPGRLGLVLNLSGGVISEESLVPSTSAPSALPRKKTSQKKITRPVSVAELKERHCLRPHTLVAERPHTLVA